MQRCCSGSGRAHTTQAGRRQQHHYQGATHLQKEGRRQARGRLLLHQGLGHRRATRRHVPTQPLLAPGRGISLALSCLPFRRGAWDLRKP